MGQEDEGHWRSNAEELAGSDDVMGCGVLDYVGQSR